MRDFRWLSMRAIIYIFHLFFIPYLHSNEVFKPHIHVFHYIIHYWGTLYWGDQSCPNTKCEFFHAHKMDMLAYLVRHNDDIRNSTDDIKTVSVYNIHYLHQSTRRNHPDLCNIRTNFTVAESEESYVRFGFLFNATFPNFDGTDNKF